MPRVLLLVSLLLATPALQSRGGASGPERIVLVVVDMLRRDHVGVYGGDVATPSMDALARRGRAYTGYRAAFHQTSMSMGALFTGRIPSIESGDPARPLPWTGETWCGMARFSSGGGEACLPSGLPTLAEELRSAGYWTIGVASNHFLYAPSGYERGFDDWVEVGRAPRSGEHRDPDATRDTWRLRRWPRVQAAVAEALARRPKERLFLYVHYMDVHDWPFAGVTYAESVVLADRASGALLSHLESQGLLEDSVVIVTSDHAERLLEVHPPFYKPKPGHTGNPSFEEVLGVPLIVAPALAPGLGVPKHSQDLFHAIRRIAGLSPGEPGGLAPDEQFLGELRHRSYRKGSWKLIEQRGTGRVMLFDLESDPAEQRDVAGANPEIVASHRRRMNELAEGFVPEHLPRRRELDADDRERLRELGYLEE